MALSTVAAALATGCSGGPVHRESTPSTVGPDPSTTTALAPTTSGPPPTTAPPTTTPVPSTTTTTRPAPPATTAGAQVATAAPCPATLAGHLQYTGSARQLVTVVASGYATTSATVQIWQRSGGCWVSAGGPWPALIGQTGFSDHHREGDGSTPTGIYGLGPVMYGNAADPGTREPYHRLVCGDWWDENPASAGYNTFQHVACGTTPSWAPGSGSEALWQETAPYPSFAVIDYNTGPVVAGAGSAIFLHAYTGSPTVGCVSIPLADLDLTLRWLDPAQAPAFVMGPASEIARF